MAESNGYLDKCSVVNSVLVKNNVCLCKKKVVGGIVCVLCKYRYHFSCTNTNKSMEMWTCKNCAHVVKHTVYSQQRNIENKLDISNCVTCEDLKNKLSEQTEELLNQQLICDLLSKDLRECRNYIIKLEGINNMAAHEQERKLEFIQNTKLNNEASWCEVVAKGVKQKQKKGRPIENIRKPTVVNNRYEVFNDVCDAVDLGLNVNPVNLLRNGVSTCLEIDGMNEVKIGPKIKKKIKECGTTGNKHKVIILGDSHGRGCASELNTQLDKSFDVIGFVKPGAPIEEILKTRTNDVMKLTKDDFLVILGGANDVAKNESKNIIHELNKHITTFKETNVIVMSVPHRYDLIESSCVNKEITFSNRKVTKWAKPLTNTTVLDINLDKAQYTKHGLHLNAKGKYKMAKSISEHITYVTHASRPNSKPIIISWYEENETGKDNQDTCTSEARNEVQHDRKLPETIARPSKEADDINTRTMPEQLIQEDAVISEKESTRNSAGFLENPIKTIITI